MAEFGPLVAGDEFLGNCPGNIGLARLVPTQDPNSPYELRWAPGTREGSSSSSERYRDILTIQHLYYGLCGDYIKPLNKNLELGELVQNDNGDIGEVVAMNWIGNVEMQLKRGAALNVPFSKLKPLMDFYKGERIYLNGWLGVVTRVINQHLLCSRNNELCDFVLRDGFRTHPTFDMPVTKCYSLFNHRHFDMPSYYGPDLLWIKGFPSSESALKDLRVDRTQLLRVGVHWIDQVPGTTAPRPNSDIDGDTLNQILHFDTSGLSERLKTNYCYFRDLSGSSDKEYRIVKRRVWKRDFVQMMFRKDGDGLQAQQLEAINSNSETESDTEDENNNKENRNYGSHSTSHASPPKISKLDRASSKSGSKASKNESRTFMQPQKLVEGDIVDVVLLQQEVTVAWDNDATNCMSRDLKRLSTRPCQPFRQFVQHKTATNPVISYGITVKRFLERNEVQVKWYKRHVTSSKSLKHGSEVELVTEDTIIPHARFGNIKSGELVVRDYSRSCFNNSKPTTETGRVQFSFGIVTGINLKFGLVRVESLHGNQYEVHPDDLTVLNSKLPGTVPTQPIVPKPSTEIRLPIEGASGDTGSISEIARVYAAFSTQFDCAYLRDIKQLQSPDNRLPRGVLLRAFADSKHLLSMLVIGPTGTPYEEGLFMFDIRLPVPYPTQSPSFQLKTQFSKPISYNLDAAGLVDVPFLTGWRGIEKWSSDMTLVDAIASVTNTIFVAEPADNTLQIHYRRYTSDPAIRCPGAITEADRNRRGFFNLIVMMEVVDSLILLALNPIGIWHDVITAHLVDVLPKVLLKCEEWIRALVSSSSSAENLMRAGYSVPIPMPDGFVIALTTRVDQLNEILGKSSSKTNK